MNKSTDENTAVLRKTREEIRDKYYEKLCEFFIELEPLGFWHDPLPLEAWEGMAQAWADASGYSVTLKAEILVPDSDPPPELLRYCNERGHNPLRSVGKREVASAEPMLYVRKPLEQAEADKLVEEYVQKEMKSASNRVM